MMNISNKVLIIVECLLIIIVKYYNYNFVFRVYHFKF